MSDNEKSDRLIEAASVILNAAPSRKLNTVVLNKSLFYLDLASLRDRGDTVTHNSYIALAQGPVVAQYQKRLIAKLEELGIANQVSAWNGSKPVELISPSDMSQRRFMDADLSELARVVTTYFSELTSAQASEFSHANPGWEQAWRQRDRIGKPVAIDLNIAMQQIIEDDPWLDSTDIDDELMQMANASEGEDW